LVKTKFKPYPTDLHDFTGHRVTFCGVTHCSQEEGLLSQSTAHCLTGL
jgi:hypothetical protein